MVSQRHAIVRSVPTQHGRRVRNGEVQRIVAQLRGKGHCYIRSYSVQRGARVRVQRFSRKPRAGVCAGDMGHTGAATSHGLHDKVDLVVAHWCRPAGIADTSFDSGRLSLCNDTGKACINQFDPVPAPTHEPRCGCEDRAHTPGCAVETAKNLPESVLNVRHAPLCLPRPQNIDVVQ